MREDLLKFNKIIDQCNLLFNQKIETLEELSKYKSLLNDRIQTLTQNRKNLKYQLKRLLCIGAEEEQIEVKAKIANISAELKKLPIEIRLCDGIVCADANLVVRTICSAIGIA